MAAKLPDQENKRPSVETTLHSLFPHTFVLHLHPALVNGLTCSQNGKTKAYELFGDKIIWVDVCKPGYILSKICFDLMEEYKEKQGKSADIILLENHGVFVAGNTVEELISAENKKVRELINSITPNIDDTNLFYIVFKLYHTYISLATVEKSSRFIFLFITKTR